MTFPPPLTFSAASGSDFYLSASNLDIYVDEQWPGCFDSSRDQEAVVSVLVVPGGLTPQLPQLADHQFAKLTDTERCHLLQSLFLSRPVFPFLLRLQTPGRQAVESREVLLGAALRLLLGCVVPRPAAKKVSFRLFVDQDDGKSYRPGMDLNPVARALLVDAQRNHPRLFKAWELAGAEVIESSHPLISWCDFLNHALPRPDLPNRKAYTDWANASNWPGFAEVADSQVESILRAANPSPAALPSLVDTMLPLSRFRWGREILAVWQGQMDRYGQRLLREFLRRYDAPDRDVRLLERQYLVLRDHLLPANPDPPRGYKLVSTALQFHYANHRGDPSQAETAAADFQRSWRKIGRGDPELALHTAILLAVHDFDQFEFDRANLFLNDVEAEFSTSGLSPRLRGILLSVRAQTAALLRRPDQAESLFASAIQELQEIDDPIDRTQEVARTTNYRMANLADFDSAALSAALQHRFPSLPETLVRLASASAMPDDYEHALLLRSIYLAGAQPWSRDLAFSYLQCREQWCHGNSHPWEFIYLYRALLLYIRAEETLQSPMNTAFRQALRVCSAQSRGFTMRLIAAMIATCAFLCTGDLAFREQAEASFPEPGHAAADRAMASLRAMLAKPEDFLVTDALLALPFYYH